MNHLKPGLMDDENTALWPSIGIKNPVSLVLMRPGLKVLRSSAPKRLIYRLLAAPKN